MKPWEDRYHFLRENLPDAYTYQEVIKDSNGHPMDYRLLEVNHVFEEMTGLSRDRVLGQRLSSVMPYLLKSLDLHGIYSRVVLSEGSLSFDQYIEGLNAWYTITAYSDEPGFLALLFCETTEVKGREDSLIREDDAFLSSMDSLPAYVVLMDREGRICSINKTMLEATGYSLEEVRGAYYVDIFVPQPQQEQLTQLFQSIVQEKRPTHNENSILTKEGRALMVEWYGWPFVKRDGSIDSFYGVGIDITRNKQVEESLKEQYNLSISLSKAHTIEEILSLSLKTVLKVTEMDCGGVYLLHTSSGTISFQVHLGFSKSSTPDDSHLYLDIERLPLVKSGRPLYSNVMDLEDSLDAQNVQEGLGAFALLPILFEGDVIATINLSSHALDRVPENDKIILESIAAQVGNHIARLKAERRIKDREKKYRAAFEGVHDAITIFHRDKGFLDCNERALDLFGLESKEDFHRLNPFEFSPLCQPDGQISKEVFDFYIGKAMEEGEHLLFECMLQRKRGEVFLAEIILTAYPLGGEMVIQSTIRDITHRKKAEDDIRDRNKELTSLFTISTHMRSAKNSTELVPIVLDEVLQLLKGHSAMVILLSNDQREFEVSGAKGEWEGSIGQVFPVDQRIIDVLLKIDKPYVTTDFSSDPYSLPFDPSSDPAIYVPLQSEENLLGILILQRKSIDGQSFSPSEVHLLRAVGEMVGNALRRQQLFESSKARLEQLEALRRIDTAITGDEDLTSTLEITISQVIEMLHVDAAAILRLYPDRLLKYLAWSGFKEADLREVSLHPGDNIWGQMIRERSFFWQAELDPALHADPMTQEGFVGYCAVPLVARDEVKGILEVFHHKPLYRDEEWLKFMETLAGQAAIAIDNNHLFTSLEYANVELTLAYDATIEGWAYALDLRDEETEGHSQRVTKMTIMMALAMDVPEDRLLHIRRGALLHDIGKMGIPDSILLKPGKLSSEEWTIMKRHPQYAWDMLYPIEYLRPALQIPFCHHERWDGGGYPRGLKGDEIPLEARIFAVVDVYDALTSDRPYRSAWTKEEALELIGREKGKHFDPKVAELFLEKME